MGTQGGTDKPIKKTEGGATASGASSIASEVMEGLAATSGGAAVSGDVTGSSIHTAPVTHYIYNGSVASLGKTLDSVKLTLLVPAFALVLCSIFLTRTATAPRASAEEALRQFSDLSFASVLFLGLAVLALSMVLEAFRPGVTSFLEGHWLGWEPVARLLVRSHSRRRAKAHGRLRRATARSFKAARVNMLSIGIDHEIIAAFEADALGTARPAISASSERFIHQVDWRDFSSPELRIAIDGAVRKVTDYPAPSRVMPTHLGNIMRSIEDRLASNDLDARELAERVETYWRGKAEHLLDMIAMYSLLTLILLGAASASALLLVAIPPISAFGFRMLSALTFLLLSRFCYAAAMQCARNYGGVMVGIDRSLSR